MKAPGTIAFSAYQQLVAQELGVSKWIDMDQVRIDRFGDVTEDMQFIHTDPVRAETTPFGGTIAHGFLTLSMLSTMHYDVIPEIEGATMGVNLGFNSLRFLSPVRSGCRIRGRFMLKEFSERKPGHWQSIIGTVVEIEGEDRPALAADWVTLTTF